MAEMIMPSPNKSKIKELNNGRSDDAILQVYANARTLAFAVMTENAVTVTLFHACFVQDISQVNASYAYVVLESGFSLHQCTWSIL